MIKLLVVELLVDRARYICSGEDWGREPGRIGGVRRERKGREKAGSGRGKGEKRKF